MTSAVIPLAGIALPLILVPIVLTGGHLSRKRKYAHEERMAAIKAGITPAAESNLPGPGSIVAIGAVVPIVALVVAFLTSLAVQHRAVEPRWYMAMIWFSTAVVGLSGMGVALILNLMLHRAHERAEAHARASSTKPSYDPDMFETAGRSF